jgi:hypothetical protein
MTTKTTNSIKPLPARVDPAGHRWGAFEARRGDEALRVHEHIYDSADKESWSDVYTWCWQAMIGKTGGSWWAMTVAEWQ